MNKYFQNYERILNKEIDHLFLHSGDICLKDENGAPVGHSQIKNQQKVRQAAIRVMN